MKDEVKSTDCERSNTNHKTEQSVNLTINTTAKKKKSPRMESVEGRIFMICTIAMSSEAQQLIGCK